MTGKSEIPSLNPDLEIFFLVFLAPRHKNGPKFRLLFARKSPVGTSYSHELAVLFGRGLVYLSKMTIFERV